MYEVTSILYGVIPDPWELFLYYFLYILSFENYEMLILCPYVFILCINMFVGEGFTLFTHSYHKLHWWVEVYDFMFWKTWVFFSWTVYVHPYPVSTYEILSSQSSVCPGFLKLVENPGSRHHRTIQEDLRRTICRASLLRRTSSLQRVLRTHYDDTSIAIPVQAN